MCVVFFCFLRGIGGVEEVEEVEEVVVAST